VSASSGPVIPGSFYSKFEKVLCLIDLRIAHMNTAPWSEAQQRLGCLKQCNVRREKPIREKPFCRHIYHLSEVCNTLRHGRWA
jgi:hypothetical protein